MDKLKIRELEAKIEKQANRCAKLKNNIEEESRLDDLCCDWFILTEGEGD